MKKILHEFLMLLSVSGITNITISLLMNGQRLFLKINFSSTSINFIYYIIVSPLINVSKFTNAP